MRVLEIGDGIAAAFCCHLLELWGAEVTRVDLPRAASEENPWYRLGAEGEWLELYLNGGKQRVTLDYRDPAGRVALDQMAAGYDVLVTDCSPRETDDWGLLKIGRGEQPAIRTSITPFGLSGPYRDWKATPATLLALGGQTFLMGDPDRAPLTMPGHYPEYQAGLFAYSATLAAIFERRGAGTRAAPHVIEVSILEAMVTLHQHTTVQWTYGGKIRSRHGNRFGDANHPLTILPCKDGWFGMCITPNFWEKFVMLLGRPDLITDERFAAPVDRAVNADELDEIMVGCFAERTKHELMIEGQETWRVPVGIVATLDDMLEDTHLAARGFWQEVEHPDRTVLRHPGLPFRFVDGPLPPESPSGVFAPIPKVAASRPQASVESPVRPTDSE